ncbi:hypothetical protein [Sphingomonas sp.]|jgi:hypothetical protein|uniref:hypothetical protein n=1 Tax=Sphingomonas sp. TaxID=28214 RepID=UPI000DBBD753|nr:hypothetical protein [Sphingomonas sp.]PZT91641.1 MAG: hypothetical protein DI625_15050 [Sphingomonas sp.]
MSAPQNRLATAAAMTIGQAARRIGLLRTAVEFLGQPRAAAALGIEQRSLRAKLEATRGVHDDNLRFVATALEKYAADLLTHATTIRAALGGREDAA